MQWLTKFFSGFRLYLLIPGLIFILISTLAFLGGVFWPWGWAMGTALVLFSGKSDSEKKGYRF